MDIFDLIIDYLNQQKRTRNRKVYLNQHSRSELDAMIQMAHSPEKLQAWLAEKNLNEAPPEKAEPEISAPAQPEAPMPPVEPEQPAQPQVTQTEIEATSAVSEQPVTQPVAPTPAVQKLTVETKVVMRDDYMQQIELGDTKFGITFSKNRNAEILFIGEEIQNETVQKPFQKSLPLLEKMITAMQFNMNEVALAGILKPVSGEELNPQLLQPYLSKIINHIQPKVIIIMSMMASSSLLGVYDSILNTHGSWHRYGNYNCLLTFHPFFLDKVSSRKGDAWKDLQQVMQFLGRS